ncbi:hypothetical protein [Bradyrhizobium liaoningense]
MRIHRPDLAIYSQTEEASFGRDPTWNNPDIVTNDWGPFHLMEAVEARIANYGGVVGRAVGAIVGVIAGVAVAAAIGCATPILCLLALLAAIIVAIVCAILGAIAGGHAGKAAGEDEPDVFEEAGASTVGELVTFWGNLATRRSSGLWTRRLLTEWQPQRRATRTATARSTTNSRWVPTEAAPRSIELPTTTRAAARGRGPLRAV